MCNWERSVLKTKAKKVLKTSYWKAFLVALLITVTGGGGNFGFKFNSSSTSSVTVNNDPSVSVGNVLNFPHSPGFSIDSVLGFPHFFWAMFGVFTFFIVILALAFGILLSAPLEVNGKKYYLRAASGEVDLGYIGFCFEKGRYMAVVKTMFFKNLYNFLWTLLLIVPGIVKSYSYRMVPYILADNPTLDTDRVIALSQKLMYDNKFKAFVLDLSFIGWYILGSIAFGIGVIFVNPYAFSTNAELYLVLREYGLQNNLCTYAELGLAEPEPDQPRCEVTIRIK